MLGLEVLYVRGASEKAGDKPSAPLPGGDRADPSAEGLCETGLPSLSWRLSHPRERGPYLTPLHFAYYIQFQPFEILVMGEKWIFATVTVASLIGPPGFEPGTARYRPRGFRPGCPPGGCLQRRPSGESAPPLAPPIRIGGRSRPLSYGPL